MLMVWGHAGLPISFAIFNMPLFFICSGFCFTDSQPLSFKDYVFKKVRGLYFPFIKWNIFFILIHNLLYNFHLITSEYSFHDIIYKIFATISVMEHRESLVGGFWFLKTLFIASIISFFIIKAAKGNNRIILLGGGIMIVISIVITHFNFVIPKLFISGKEFIATFFILFGKYIKSTNFNPSSNIKLLFINIVTVVVISYILPVGTILLVKSFWIPLFIVGAISGVWMCLQLTMFIQLYKIIVSLFLYIGRHTIEILTWHFLSFKLISIILVISLGLEIEELSSFPTINLEKYDLGSYSCIPKLLYFICGIFIPIAGCYLFERYKTNLSITPISKYFYNPFNRGHN